MLESGRIAVTGATGQVGSAILRLLHGRGINVVAVTRNTVGAALIHADVPDCEIRIGATTRGSDGVHLLDDCDTVINCAIASSGGNPKQAYVRNRALVDGLLQAKGLRRLIHFSSVAVYGEVFRKQSDERRGFERPHPEAEYGRSKLDVEHYAMQQCAARKLPCTVLRLGHVYGHGIWRSREIIELSRDPNFRLPFDGRLASNAIHVDVVALAMLKLLATAPAHEVINLAESTNTWRHIFDWHTSCLGLPPVAAMSEADSERARQAASRHSVASEVGAWVRGLPVRQLVRSPAVFDFALRMLVRTPAAVTRRASSINRRVSTRAVVAGARSLMPIPALYVSEKIPGPHLELPAPPASGQGSEADRCHELRAWSRRWSEPQLGPVARATSNEAAPRGERAAVAT